MPTIYDIARKANVSSSTVSRVFNRPDMISESTREKVLSIARELNFRPDYFASNLSTRRTLLTGLLISDIQNPYASTLARGVEDAMAEFGYLSLVCSTDGNPERELHILEEMNYRGVDGFVITPPAQKSPEVDQLLLKMIADEIPVVFVGNRLESNQIDFVTSRAQDGAALAVDYLAQLGHQRIALIAGYYTRGVAVGRWLGYQESMIQNQAILRSEYIIEADLSREGGAEAMRHLLALPEPPTAVLTVNDLMAIGALDMCRILNVSVPDDISIIGFDDIPTASLTTPPLTTIAQPTYELGHRAGEFLLNRFNNQALPAQQAILNCRLIERSTTAPPKTYHGQ